jgi:hypothetical protein
MKNPIYGKFGSNNLTNKKIHIIPLVVENVNE